MTIRRPVIVDGRTHDALPDGDALSGSAVQLSADASNLLQLGGDGGLFVPPGNASIPTLTIELGNSGQANGGHGIDRGTHYELDFNIGVTARNGFKYSVDSDGALVFGEAGVYMVQGTCNVVVPANDAYSTPTEMTFATGQQFTWPGAFPYALQRYPDRSGMSSNPSLSAGTVLGTVVLAGMLPSWIPGVPTWLGFSKINGASGANPLKLQGYLTYAKVATPDAT